MTSPAPRFTGGCLCGAVRYSTNAPITALRACHCTHCQKSSGTGGTVNAVMPTANFTITSGEPRRYTDTADSGQKLFRFFCGDCGSPLFSRREASPERTVVRAGTLDNPPAVKIAANIWTRSARSWSWIDPAIEQHPTNPPA